MKVYFSHGMESGPWGLKIKRLADIAKAHRCDVESIDYTDTFDPDERVQRLLQTLAQEKDEYVLVGSSMGGYVSLVASAQTSAKALFLIAPALYIENYQEQKYDSNCPLIEVIHGWSDEVIAVENSMRYAQSADCSLHLISGDHGLHGAIDEVADCFDRFLVKATRR